MKVDNTDRGTGLGLRALVAVLVLAMAAACTPIYRNHGYVPAPEELAEVKLGASREDVANLIGRPSAQGLLSDDGWFYVQSRWKTVGARAPQEIDRQVLSVTFTQDGRVANIEEFGLERGRVVVVSRRVTDTNIKGVSFLRQLFSNVGRMSAGQFLGQNGAPQQ